MFIDPVHTTLEEFENAALFLRLGLTSTLIHDENGAFRKCSSNRRNLKTPALRFSVNDGVTIIRWFPVPARVFFFSNHKIKNDRWLTTFSNFYGVVWTGPWAWTVRSHFDVSVLARINRMLFEGHLCLQKLLFDSLGVFRVCHALVLIGQRRHWQQRWLAEIFSVMIP